MKILPLALAIAPGPEAAHACLAAISERFLDRQIGPTTTRTTMIKYFLAGLATVTSLAHAAPSLQNFFESPRFKSAKLSPSGRYVAMRAGDDTHRDSMVVMDTETLKIIGGVRGENDVADFRWVNDKRLVYTVLDFRSAPGDRWFAPGLYGINRDGSEPRQLVEHTWSDQSSTESRIRTRMEPWNTYLMADAGAQDSDSIYMLRLIWPEKNGFAIDRTELVKLNTTNGQATPVSRPAPPQGWMLDQKGQPSIMVSEKEGKDTVHFRNSAGEWQELATFPSYGRSQAGIAPVGFFDDKRLLVKSRQSGDKAGLYLMDLASGKLDPEPLVSLADFDFIGGPVYSNKRLAGIHYTADASASAWFDPGLQATQQEVNQKLPGLINIMTPPLLPETDWVLVTSRSDRQPDFFSLYNRKSHVLKVLGGNHPDIKASEMGRMDIVKYRARDGLEVPAWLTLPAKGGKPLPLVVMVHGGPYVRGTYWQWDSDAQFLASRGYAVLEPEFRGSTGYGDKLFRAGLKQWGLKMQDDIADSVKWAVDKGIADPARVCIMGASYGGYATLMGLVNNPELFRCGIAYAAVTDIPLMFESGMSVLSDMNQDYKTFGAPMLVGDLDKDAAQFIATSPLKQAARIKRPLLLAHGSDDRRVPMPHFSRMRNALQDAKAEAEFVEYAGEGHGWSTLKTRLDFWGRVEKFLNKHIGAK